MNGPEWMDERIEPGSSDPDRSAWERELSEALRPVELPAGFADRVLRAAAVEGRSRVRARVLPFRLGRLAVGGAIAASVLAGSLVVESAREHRDRARQQEIANQQFETATRITEQTLAQTREELQQAGALSIQ